MSGRREAEGMAVPLAVLMHIEAICDRFEAAWRADDRPDLAAFMADGPGPNQARDRLLRGLLTLDLEFRIGRGDSPDPQLYIEQFPEYSSAIREVFADFGHGQANPSLAEHRDRIPGPGTLAAGPGADTQFGEALPRADLSSAAIEALRSAGYEIYGELGRGGMGVVYLARKMALNRPCALKMILAGPHAGSAAAARFRTEAEAVARLRHPGIVQIYHVGEAGGLPFLELEYLPGGNLDRALDGTPKAPEKAAQIVEVLARAMAEAHGKGIVHRDLKPANVLLDADGSPKIADFGLAKLLDSDSDLTRTQTVLGSPSYMAPEQAEGRSHLAGAATDVYALGAILYTLLTGGPPFRGATELETLAQVKSTDPVPPSRLQPGLPRDLETICLKCLEKAPARRYLRAEHLAEDLRRYQTGEPILARRAGPWERGWKWSRRRPALATALAVSVTALCLLLSGALYHYSRLQSMLRRTQAAETVAVDRGKLVIEAYNRLVSDVQIKLGKTAATRSIRQELLTTAIEGLDKVASSIGAGAPDLDRAVAHQKLGEILRQVGRAEEARQQFEHSIRLAQNLAADSAGDRRAAECLRDAYLGLGELILREDRPDAAEAYFRRAVQEAQSVEAAEPDEAGARASLIEAYHRLGRAHEAQNQRLPEAEKQFRAMHELAARWVRSEPESITARDLLASSYLRLGRVLKRRNAADAGTSYGKAIELAQEVLDRQPKNLEYKFHLALAVVDSAIFALDRKKYSEARPLLDQSERLFEELVAADPEDRENQVWLVHTLYQYGCLERDEDHFAKAEDDFRRALDRLRRLDREGKLEGRPAFKYRHVQSLEREIAYCSAAPGILDDPTMTRSTFPYVTIKLLLLRVMRLAEQSRVADMADNARKLCAFEDGDGSDQFTLSRALATCVRYLENDRLQGMSERERSDLKRRCTDRAVAALSRALDKGFTDLFDLNATVDLDPIRGDPGFQALVLRLKERQGPGSWVAGAP